MVRVCHSRYRTLSQLSRRDPFAIFRTSNLELTSNLEIRTYLNFPISFGRYLPSIVTSVAVLWNRSFCMKSRKSRTRELLYHQKAEIINWTLDIVTKETSLCIAIRRQISTSAFRSILSSTQTKLGRQFLETHSYLNPVVSTLFDFRACPNIRRVWSWKQQCGSLLHCTQVFGTTSGTNLLSIMPTEWIVCFLQPGFRNVHMNTHLFPGLARP